MKCPACSSGRLKPKASGDIELDVCEGGCGGIWFDWMELKKLDEPHEHVGENLLEVPFDASVKVDHDAKRNCPKCEDIVMMRQFFSAKREVEIDLCGKCGGYWLDLGELHTIRQSFESEEKKKEHATKAFDDMFAEQLDAMKQQSDEKLENARRVARILRFICPSYYIPGKQDGGAW